MNKMWQEFKAFMNCLIFLNIIITSDIELQKENIEIYNSSVV